MMKYTIYILLVIGWGLCQTYLILTTDNFAPNLHHLIIIVNISDEPVTCLHIRNNEHNILAPKTHGLNLKKKSSFFKMLNVQDVEYQSLYIFTLVSFYFFPTFSPTENDHYFFLINFKASMYKWKCEKINSWI